MKKKKKIRKIEIFSFGHAYPELYPSCPGNDLQIVLDIRALCLDPYRNFFAGDGNSKKIIKFVLSQPRVKKFLKYHKKEIEAIVEGMEEEGFSVLRIYYGCIGGHQRSPAIANHMYKWLLEKFFPRYKIIKKHTSPSLKEGIPRLKKGKK